MRPEHRSIPCKPAASLDRRGCPESCWHRPMRQRGYDKSPPPVLRLRRDGSRKRNDEVLMIVKWIALMGSTEIKTLMPRLTRVNGSSRFKPNHHERSRFRHSSCSPFSVGPGNQRRSRMLCGYTWSILQSVPASGGMGNMSSFKEARNLPVAAGNLSHCCFSGSLADTTPSARMVS